MMMMMTMMVSLSHGPENEQDFYISFLFNLISPTDKVKTSPIVKH